MNKFFVLFSPVKITFGGKDQSENGEKINQNSFESVDFKSSTWKVSWINVQSVCSKSMNSSELNYSTKKPSAFLTEK